MSLECWCAVRVEFACRCLTCKCSRQAGAGQRFVRAPASSRPLSGGISLCGRENDRLQLICLSLDSANGARHDHGIRDAESAYSQRIQDGCA